ncbi:MAG: hypothetical protein KDE27_31875, partial [Planctomycetes bacterium]|nr:hypothetical protein [Planctomycetota bacterium]
MRESPRETVLLPQLGARPMGSLAASLTATLSIGLGGSLCLTNSLPAQCGTEWVAVAGVPGTEHWAYCSTAWDPDGPGPRTPVLILGGMFQTAGGIRAEHIAMFDPATGSWSPLDAGLTGASTGFMATYALLTLPNGDLVAGGNFALAGSTAASNIARWDGTSWKPFGSGMNGAVSALCVAPNGDLLAGGGFTLAGGVSAQGIARWDGASWHAFGSGTNSTVTAIAVVPNGDVVAGGWFTSAGGTPANYIARWDGAAWHALGAGLAQTAAPPVSSLAVLPTGDLAVGGAFNFAGNLLSPCLALWTGTSWSAFGSGADSTVDA